MATYTFFHVYWRGILVSLAIIYLSLAPPSGFEKIPVPSIDGLDKVAHFFMYFGLTIACILDIRFSRRSISNKIKIIHCVLFPLLLGGMLEIIQWQFTTYRSGNWFDMLVNTLGVAAGYFLMLLLMYKRK